MPEPGTRIQPERPAASGEERPSAQGEGVIDLGNEERYGRSVRLTLNGSDLVHVIGAYCPVTAWSTPSEPCSSADDAPHPFWFVSFDLPHDLGGQRGERPQRRGEAFEEVGERDGRMLLGTRLAAERSDHRLGVDVECVREKLVGVLRLDTIS